MLTTTTTRLRLRTLLRLRMLLRLRTMHLWLRPVLLLRLWPVHLRRRSSRIRIRCRPVHRRGRAGRIIIIIRHRSVHRRRRPPRIRRRRSPRTRRRSPCIGSRTPRRRCARMINSRPRYRRLKRPSMIDRSKLVPVMHSRLLMLLLLGRTLDMPVPHRRLLTRIGTITNPARAAIITHTIHRYIPDNGSIDIHIADNGSIDTRNSRIIPEMSAIPLPSIITTTTITTTIIDAAIVSYMRSPISGVPPIQSADKTPVTRRPIKSCLRWLLPITRHPIITLVSISPVTRYPDKAIYRAGWLLINRYGRRCCMNGNSNTDLCIHSRSSKTDR